MGHTSCPALQGPGAELRVVPLVVLQASHQALHERPELAAVQRLPELVVAVGLPLGAAAAAVPQQAVVCGRPKAVVVAGSSHQT